VISISVIVCHLFMATNQVSPFRLQLRSMTSLDVSLPRDERTDFKRSSEKRPLGNRKEVMMTYCCTLAHCVLPSMTEKCSFGEGKERGGGISKRCPYLFSTGVDPLFGVGVVDAAANL